MKPSLRRRISFGEFRGAATGLTDRSALARTWTYFFAAGGTLCLVAVLLPHDRATYEPGVLACGALAYGVAVAALLLFDRIPLAVSQLVPAVGTLLISAAAVFEGSGTSVYPVVYAWVAVAAALERVSAVLMAAKRRVDVAARMGGEEFALIVPASGEEAARVLAEHLRAELRRTFADDPVPLTVSFGVAGCPGGATTPGALLEAADRALYRAKEAGRDRSVVA